jgi:hypothetical protein
MSPLAWDGYHGHESDAHKTSGLARGAVDRTLSLGIWTWLAIIEKERDQLSDGGRAALGALRDDLERLANG